MSNKVFALLIFLMTQLSFSQAIDVNPIGAPESSHTISELINGTLTDPCSSGTNITYRYCNDVSNSGVKSYGYFQYTPPAGQDANDTNFPFEEGIILSTGACLTAEGPNPADPFNTTTGNGIQTFDQNGAMTGNGATNWIGDPDIKEILDDRLGGDFETFNATVIEFDFVSLTEDLSFDYLFASEEWESGTNECPGSDYLDGFAFIITGPGIVPDLKANGQPFAHGGKNIALIPNTNIPVSAGSIYNNGLCNPAQANENLYIPYTNAAATNSPINFNARTVKLTAEETVIAGETYHLKLVVADRGDGTLDSAVLVAADSFTTAPTLTINGVEVGETQPVCQGGGDSVTINGEMVLDGLTGAVQYQWLHNGVEMTVANGYPQDENHYELTTNINGTYTLVASLPLSTGACDTMDSATITFLPDTTIGDVPDMRLCDSGNGTASFPIDDNDVALLNGQDQTLYSVSYHLDPNDAISGDNPITPPYIGATQEIFTRVILTNDPDFCFATGSFHVYVDEVPTATQPANPIRICDDLTNGQFLEEFDLTLVENEILDGQSLADVNITYYDNSTTPPTLIPNANVSTYFSGPKTIGVIVANNNNTNCTASTTFEILTDLIPVAIQPSEMRACDDEDAATGDVFGEEMFDLTTQNETILGGPISAGGLDPTQFTINYYWVDNSNPANPVNVPITTPTAYNLNIPYPEYSQEIFATLSNNENNTCSTTVSFFIYRDDIYTTAVASDELNITLCDDVNPGDLIEVFNLDAQIPAILGTAITTSEATVTFYLTQADADTNNTLNAITNTNAFTSTTTNVSPFTQTIYYTISNNNNTTCYSTGSLVLQVDALPDIVDPIEPYYVCDSGTPGDFADFDFSSSEAMEIINQITQGNTNYYVSFFTNSTDAQNNTNPIPVDYFNQPSQTLHVRVEDLVTNCVSYTTLMLEVAAAPQVYPFTNPLIVCDDDNDGVNYFDLSTLENDITGNIAGVTVQFYETLTQAELGQGAINTGELYQNIDTGTLGLQTLYASLTINGLECHTIIDVNLVVLESPELPSGELVYDICEDNGSADGYVEFDLMNYATNELGLDSTVFNINFFTGIDTSGNPIGYIPNFNSYTNVTTPDQEIYMAVSNSNQDSNGDFCTTVRPITLHVNLLPNVPVFHEMHACDDDYFDEMDGIYPFDLDAEIFVITGGVTGLGITFHETFGEAEAGINPIPNPSVYENSISGADDVFARVFDESTGCYAITHIKLHVDANPTPLSTQNIIDQLGNDGVMEECDGDVDGSGSIAEQVAEFDLTLWETLILTGENGPGVETGVSASYYTSYDDADGGSNAIATPETYTNTSNPQTIYVRVTNDGSGVIPQTAGTGCYTIVEFEIYVPVPEVSVSGNTVLCVDENGVPLSGSTLPVLTASPSTGGYEYQWALNGVDIPGANTATYTATEPGEYTVTISGPTDFDCVNYASITVEESGMPDGFDANVTTTAFADNHQILAEATSSIPGVEFYYSLDNGDFTTDGLFTDVAPGLHYITITDGEGCWSEIIEIFVIDYPHFFTPNGDGVNDTWHIIGQDAIPVSIIYIFDRYGKLLAQLDPDGAGWDGTYNGHAMPAGDYWFKIQYTEGDVTPTQKEFKAHFSIKR